MTVGEICVDALAVGDVMTRELVMREATRERELRA